MAGRKPKPTKLKLIAGNPRKRPLNDREPEPKPGIQECPTHLDEEARAEWERIAPELSAMGVLARIDRAALAAYCQAWSRWVKTEGEILKRDLVVKTPGSGYPMQNPYIPIANTAMDFMRKFLVEFGLTPASRSRFMVGKQDKVDDDAERFFS